MKLGPHIHRIGTGTINVYLVEEAGQVTIVDAGLPGYWADLPTELAAMGRTFDDVRAVVLTHGHIDHIGFAERARRERGLDIRVHELDAALARGEVKGSQSFGKVRVRSLVGFLALGIRKGMLRVPPIREVVTFGDGATLDVPGAPRVIHVPGHSPGSAALHMASHGALFVGDALTTGNPISGEVGPRIAPFSSDTAQALASLGRIEGIDAELLLPGHGQPWREGPAAAVAAVRRTAARG